MPRRPHGRKYTDLDRESTSFGDSARRYLAYVTACPANLAAIDECARASCGHCIPCDVEQILEERLRQMPQWQTQRTDETPANAAPRTVPSVKTRWAR
jgi:hypothetical protein